MDTQGKVEAAPQLWLCCVQVTAETQGLPLATPRGVTPLLPHCLVWTPVGNMLSSPFTLLDQLHRLLNIISPIVFALKDTKICHIIVKHIFLTA